MAKREKKLYMGADPGRTGAVGVIDEDLNVIKVVDCPIHKLTKEIDVVKFFDGLKPFVGKIQKCVLEKAQVMPHDAKTRAFGYGQTVGTFKTLLTLGAFNYIEVYPRTWKKFFKLGPNKDLSRDKARRDLKNVEHLITRRKDHNRAEALLLAYYAYLMDTRQLRMKGKK